MSTTWAERFAAMSHEDRVMTIVEDGSTLDALITEADHTAISSDLVRALRFAVALMATHRDVAAPVPAAEIQHHISALRAWIPVS